jgi:drug/metabolite transporter (DMT)-like permease
MEILGILFLFLLGFMFFIFAFLIQQLGERGKSISFFLLLGWSFFDVVMILALPTECLGADDELCGGDSSAVALICGVPTAIAWLVWFVAYSRVLPPTELR